MAKKINNPTGKGGFGDHPENRGTGQWDSTQTVSFQYKKLLAMTMEELLAWAKANAETMTVAQRIAYNTLLRSQKSLMDVKEVTDRTEGKAAQSIDLTTGGEQIQTIVKIIDERQNSRSPDTD